MKTNNDWQWVGGDFKTAFATTDDPRVVAVIERDDDTSVGESLDGDAIPSVYSVDYRGEYRADHVGGYIDDALAQRIIRARSDFRYTAGYRFNGLSGAMITKSEEILERWARIYHEAVFRIFDHGSDTWMVLIGNEYRENVGAAVDLEADRESVESIAREVRDILDGDVYGIGFSVNEGRRLDDDEEIDLDDANWVTDIECWGFIGEDYAKASAARFDAGEPSLDPMLELPSFHEPDHTDRMAEMSILDARLDQH